MNQTDLFSKKDEFQISFLFLWWPLADTVLIYSKTVFPIKKKKNLIFPFQMEVNLNKKTK